MRFNANRICNWDSGVWDSGRWSKYSATWDNGVWGESDWDFVWSALMDELLAQQEKKNVSVTYIDYAVIKPGIADYTPLDNVLTRLET